jgi:predicted  nucleic acid-binding Zn-ribbon protein
MYNNYILESATGFIEEYNKLIEESNQFNDEVEKLKIRIATNSNKQVHLQKKIKEFNETKKMYKVLFDEFEKCRQTDSIFEFSIWCLKEGHKYI